jgi:cysteine desulfurase
MPMVYLDHNAATPLDPRVLEAMLPWLRGKWGNASSRDHAFGWDARDAVEDARAHVADLLHAGPHEIVFTGGASESSALCLQGVADACPGPANLILSAVEHEAVRGAARALARRGAQVRELPVDGEGRPDPAVLSGMLAAERADLVCVQAANNETGVLPPFRELAEAARSKGARFFLDAAQAAGKIPLDLGGLDVDFAAVSAHKLYGPKGVGALFLRGGPEAAALRSPWDGGQEGGLRSGTLDVPAIVGFGEACRLASAEMAGDAARMARLRDRLEAALRARFPQIRAHGAGAGRLPNTSNLSFPGAEGRALIRDMHDVAASTRSACSSGSSEPSHVLTAMGVAAPDAFASVRFSLGRATTEADIDHAVAKATEAYARVLALRN